MIGRVRALRRRWGDAPDFLLIPEPIDMMNPDGQEWQDLSGLVREVRPALIVIDTLARSFPGLRENEAEDMGRVVRAARDLAALTESAVLVVHHVAKESGGTPRGHGCLNGDADVTILVEGGGRDVRSVRLGKNRNGPSDATFAFNVAVEALGTDADGDPITAPIAEEADARTARTAGKVSALSGSQRTALEMLRRAVIDDGEPSPSRDIPAGVRAVRAETWRRYCYDGTISAGGTQDAKRKAFKRAADDLQARGLIGVWGELVWLAERPDPDSRTGPDKTGQRPDMSGPQEDTTRTDTDRGLSPVRCPGPVRGVLQ